MVVRRGMISAIIITIRISFITIIDNNTTVIAIICHQRRRRQRRQRCLCHIIIIPGHGLSRQPSLLDCCCCCCLWCCHHYISHALLLFGRRSRRLSLVCHCGRRHGLGPILSDPFNFPLQRHKACKHINYQLFDACA